MKLPVYHPPYYLRNGHLNTILGSYIKAPPVASTGKCTSVPYKDGDSTLVYIHDHQSPWVVLSFHGLAGSVDSDFVNRVVQAGNFAQVTTIAVNHRNSGRAHGLSSVPYHSGKGEDISDLVLWARHQFPGRKVAVIGYSLSASMILNLRAGRSGSVQPELALVINPPIDLKFSSERLTSGFSRVYGQKFVRELRQTIHGLIEKKIIGSQYFIPKDADLMDVDEIFTAPLSGFKNAHQYYAIASTEQHLQNICENTVFILAEDDPFIDFQNLKKMKLHPNVHLNFLPHGGHVGFVSGFKSKWCDVFLKDFFQQLQNY